MVRPSGTGGKAEELARDQIRRLDRCLTGSRTELRDRALIYLGLGSGMRIGELAQLRWEDVAPAGKVLSRIVLEKHSTKSGESRTVAISAQAREHLLKYRQSLSSSSERPSGPVFPHRVHPTLPMGSNGACKLLTRLFTQAGIPNASSHSLRRTHANALRRQGVDLKVIQEQLGHSSLSTTERYFVVDPLEKQRAVDLVRF